MKQTEGTADVALSFRKKIELVKMLDKLGVSVVETTPIINKKQDTLSVKSLSSAIKNSILAVPMDFNDPEAAKTAWNAVSEAAHPRLQMSLPVSAVQMEYLCHKKPSVILQLISDNISAAKALCPDVEFIAEDFGRADGQFLKDAIDAAVKAGATVITVRDIAGDMFPYEMMTRVQDLKKTLPAEVKLGVWCSNDYYMADASALAAVAAGADEIKTSPYTNKTASLNRFVQILAVKSDVCNATCDVKLTEVKKVVSRIKQMVEAKPNKPFDRIVESDKEIGEIKLSLSDDRQSVTKVVEKLGYDINEEDKDKVYEAFTRLASRNGVVAAKELDAIVASVAYQVPPTYKLESFVINSGNKITATCHLRLFKGDELLESVCIGEGPIDAAFKAIDSLVGRQYELDDFQIQSVTEGREAMGETIVRLRYEGKLYSGRGLSTDIVASGINAYLNAVNKIEFEED